uniref:Si:dkey-31j3.11 n=1 Tax=Sander lucioperca TaxID=283035 RepID=A0A8C9XHR2_SANLU
MPTDTERAVGLLRQYQANLTSPEEQALKSSVGKVSSILGSQLFSHLLKLLLTKLILSCYSSKHLKCA